MPVVNLTPHAVTVAGHTFAPSGSVARCTEESVSAGTWEGIPFARVSYGYPEGLPPETSSTLYIVSAMVRSAVPTRRDLASPGRLVRDEAGNVVGCECLIVNGVAGPVNP